MIRTWSEWTDDIKSSIDSVSDDLLVEAAAILRNASVVLTAGNGGSSALASHAAQALMKPGYKAGGGLAAVCLTDNASTATAHANDGGWPTALLECARPFLAIPGCALLLISSSGKSENICQIARSATRHPIITLTGFDGEPLKSLARLSLHVPSYDYEVVEPVHDALLHRIQYHLRQRTQRRIVRSVITVLK